MNTINSFVSAQKIIILVKIFRMLMNKHICKNSQIMVKVNTNDILRSSRD